jgi:hypothetical protein
MGLLFTTAAASAVILRSESRGTVSDSRLSQPGGPGPRIYISQEQGGPVIPPGIGFSFRQLLQLAGLRWRYSISPPHGNLYVGLSLMLHDRWSVGQYVLEWSTHWGSRWEFYYCQTFAGLLTWGALSHERTCLSFTIADGLLKRILVSESRGTRGHNLLSQIRELPFRRLLRLAGLRWRYPTPLPHGTLCRRGLIPPP